MIDLITKKLYSKLEQSILNHLLKIHPIEIQCDEILSNSFAKATQNMKEIIR